MAKPEWGTKRTCYNCGARFYDLRRQPILCPICNSVYDPERLPRQRRGGPALKEEPLPAVGVGEEELVEDALDEELVDEEAAEVEIETLEDAEETETDLDKLSSEDRDLIEDTSDLGEDDDDIGEVMEHMDQEGEEKH